MKPSLWNLLSLFAPRASGNSPFPDRKNEVLVGFSSVSEFRIHSSFLF